MNCIICGSVRYKKTIYGGYLFKGKEYFLVRCVDCGFIYLDPMPSKDVLEGIYTGDSYFNEYYIPGADKLGCLQDDDLASPHHLKAISAMKKFVSSGDLLDVGCAAGAFCLQAQRAGFNVYGLEPNKKMSEHASSRLKAEIKNGEFCKGIYPGNRFDVINMADVLEHVPSPAESLELAGNLLRDSGILVLEQPLTYNRSLFNIFLRFNMLFKKERLSDSPPTHLWEFRPETLRAILKTTGFEVIYEEVYENRAKPDFVYKKLSFKNRLSIGIKNISSFISGCTLLRWLKCGDRAVVVCRKIKPRVLFVHPTLGIGGAEKNRLNILKMFDSSGLEISICCIKEKGDLAEEFIKLGFKVDCLNKSDRSLNLFTTFALLRYLKRGSFSIVHSCLTNTNLHTRLAAWFCRVPVIIAEEQSEYERYNRRLEWLLKPVNRWLARSTDRIIACSGRTALSISSQDRIPFEKFLVIHNVIDTTEFSPVKSKYQLLEELGLSREDIIVGYVASLARRKGHIYLIDAVFNLLNWEPRLKLVLVGDGPLRNELEESVSERRITDRVLFTGKRRDIADLLPLFSVFVSPALNEAFGIVLIEAMYMGVACVATRVGGVPEVIQDRESGILVNPADSKALADAIKELLLDPGRASLYADAARKRVIENFTADRYAQKLSELYKELLGAKLKSKRSKQNV
ncbi:MAG: glycosyltransferase [Candidatus Omnitrophota bacterium]|jgi:glycosyltransferase involved in cell wall biosynthesis/2-polyprenyl-3-methyl-5-hydroxy-6-metoxy-1,4-benzoquinol methylase|nr:MAG: glycosyltransferase [Candidatus Omnitrophota bacterium]